MNKFWLTVWDAFMRLMAAFTPTPVTDPVIPPEPVPTPVPPPEPPKPPEPPVEPDDNGFVWKPISDNDRLLAVVTPAKHDFDSVTVFYGLKKERGRYTGRANGNRQTWRYRHPGAFYGKDIKVKAANSVTGESSLWLIKNGAVRTERR